ncbi:hypothetical protein CLU79DRAFT_742676 [Phycomyces nitens]|nr:hypothetical protein CLU79DRAFT_742676 [Phycomyces nitens]
MKQFMAHSFIHSFNHSKNILSPYSPCHFPTKNPPCSSNISCIYILIYISFFKISISQKQGNTYVSILLLFFM